MGRWILVCVFVFLSGAVTLAQDCTELKTRLDRAETKLNDWPALARYREDNDKLPPPAKNEYRVVFMGDSITDSWDNPTNGGFFPGKPYVNRGISCHFETSQITSVDPVAPSTISHKKAQPPHSKEVRGLKRALSD